MYCSHNSCCCCCCCCRRRSYGDHTDTRWEAPECFKTRFVCNFDDLGAEGVCKQHFDTELEVEAHRKEVRVCARTRIFQV